MEGTERIMVQLALEASPLLAPPPLNNASRVKILYLLFLLPLFTRNAVSSFLIPDPDQHS